MENQFVPFGNNIRILPTIKEQILVSDNPTFCEHGKVIAVGEDVTKIKVGDEVSFWLFGVKEVQHEDEKHFIIPVDDKFVLEVKHNG